MTDRLERCVLQLLRRKEFLKEHGQELLALYQDPEFRQILRQIGQGQDPETLYPAAPHPGNKAFKAEVLLPMLHRENVYARFPAYQAIIDTMTARGDNRRSGEISIFYAIQYLETEEAQKNTGEATVQDSEELSDADYRKKWETKFRCEDGHYVRSKNEQLVDNWLYYHGYVHAYEKLVIDQSTGREYLPDFYLPQQDTYIEVWGYQTEEYVRRRNRKTAVYHRNGLRLLQMTDNDVMTLDDFLLRSLKKGRM